MDASEAKMRDEGEGVREERPTYRQIDRQSLRETLASSICIVMNDECMNA